MHKACIQRWVDEKQKGNFSAQVSCPQCGVKYTIMYPTGGLVIVTLDSIEMLSNKVCPIMFGGLCVGSIYWSCISYGAVTLMQAVGQEKGQIIIERTDPLLLIVSLPLVPVGLVLSRMIRWEEPVRCSLPQKSCTLENASFSFSGFEDPTQSYSQNSHHSKFTSSVQLFSKDQSNIRAARSSSNVIPTVYYPHHLQWVAFPECCCVFGKGSVSKHGWIPIQTNLARRVHISGHRRSFNNLSQATFVY